MEFDDGVDRTFTYDEDSGFLTIVEDDDTYLVYSYTNLGRLESVFDDEMDKTIAYDYYYNGLRKAMQGPETESGFDYYYHYDKAGRLARVNDNAAYSSGTAYVTYTYNVLGQREYRTYANGTYTDYDYVAEINWLEKVTNKDEDENLISEFTYYDGTWGADNFDKVGNRNRIKYQVLKNDETCLQGNVHYDYDKLYQLTEEHRKDWADTTDVYKLQWSYDDAGNRVEQKKYMGSELAWENYTEYMFSSIHGTSEVSKSSYCKSYCLVKYSSEVSGKSISSGAFPVKILKTKTLL